MQYDLGREAAKISALSSKDLLEKHEYFTGEDLGCKPNVFEKAKFEYFLLGMSLSKAFKKDEVKSFAKSKSDDSNHNFFEFCKRNDEFKDISLGSKYPIMKSFNKRLIKFKNVKPTKSETQLKKEGIIKNVEEVYRKYHDPYKDEYDNGGELNGVENKKFDYKQFELVDKTGKGSKLDEETKTKLKSRLKNEKKVLTKKDLLDILTMNLVHW